MQPTAWISHALGFMSGKATHWAVPYIQKICEHIEAHAWFQSNNTITVPPFPFNGSCEDFKTAFMACFMAIDDMLAAQCKLASVQQGNKSVTNYAAQFQEIAGHTNFSDTNLQVCFHTGLNPASQMLLMQGTLDEAN